MNVEKKVGYTLKGIGLLLLVATAVFKLPIIWPVFGMACLILGTYKVIHRLVVDRNESKPIEAE